MGLSLETRPDHVTEEEVLGLRRLGATKVQLGIQSLADDVLGANERGHGVAETRLAIRRLRAAGFKIHAHWMPNLLGSTPERDLEDYERLFADPEVRPDELKIYPCSLIEGTALVAHYQAGRWRPYERDELVELLVECVRRTPRWCRLTRIVRDIPSPEILVGSRETNLREAVERRLVERGTPSVDVRAREIRGRSVREGELTLRTTDYESAVGSEHFLEFVTPKDRVAAFARLTLPAKPSFVDELGRSALLREVHVYGEVAGLGEAARGRAQHAGLGRRLVDAASARAGAAGFASLAVISAVGTRSYYRRRGFCDGPLYQHRGQVGLR